MSVTRGFRWKIIAFARQKEVKSPMKVRMMKNTLVSVALID